VESFATYFCKNKFASTTKEHEISPGEQNYNHYFGLLFLYENIYEQFYLLGYNAM
jgi:hypothetical protein